ncbi:hypothetical protein D0T87_16700 [Bacteroides sp. 51]|nr:hypothetical protein [Bacteroides sp. 51]
MEREISTLGDSAFMADYSNKSPFLFQLDDTWKITPYDSTVSVDFLDDKMKFNVKAARKFSSLEAFREEVRPKENLDRLILPREELKKNFRWFYTYYTYQAVYPTIADRLPIPLSSYLTDKEQHILFQSDMTVFEGRNGYEMYSTLDGLSIKFEKWLQHCQYEIACTALMDELKRNGENTYHARLASARDSIFNSMDSKIKDDITNDGVIYSVFDKYFKTTFFSDFQSKNKERISEIAEQKSKLLALFEHNLCFSLEMPGKVINANTELRDNNAVVWKVDAYRFLAHDYMLQAQSRTCNVWAFLVTGLIILLAVYCFGRLSFLRKRE